MSTSNGQWSSTVKLMRRTEFRAALLGRTSATLANAMVPVLIAFAVLQVSHSVASLGFVLATGYAPQIAFLLFSGVLADRVSRRTLMLAATTANLLCQVALGLLLVSPLMSIPTLATLAAVGGLASTVFSPAAQGMVREVVPSEMMHEANAVLRGAQNVARISGPALAGLLVATFGVARSCVASTIVLAVALVFIWRVRLPDRPLPPNGFWRHLADGWSEFWSRRWLRFTVVAGAISNVAWVIGFDVLGPFNLSSMPGGAAGWGAVVAGFSAGLIVGSFVVISWKPRRPLVVGFVGLAGHALPLASIGLSAPLPVSIAAACVAGLGSEIFLLNFTTTIQRELPPDSIGRVSSWDMLLSIVPIPFAYLSAQALQSALGPAKLGLLLATASVAICLWIIAAPSTRSMRQPNPSEISSQSGAH